MLSLYEELFLLAVHEEKGTIISSAAQRLEYGLSGAVLAELAIQKKIDVDQSHHVNLLDGEPSGELVLDFAVEQIQSSPHPRKLTYWLKNFRTRAKKLQKRTAKQLVSKGILQQEDSRWMWVIPDRDHPEAQASTKYWLKAHLRELVLACGEPTIRELALLSLVKSSNLLYLVFLKDERKLAQQRIYQSLIEEAFADPVAQTLEEIETGVRDLVQSD